MEFGKHIGKGIWAFADKALPAVYGVGLIFLAIRVLPEQEYGAFVIIQTLFLLGNGFAFALAFQPLIKFLAEEKEAGSHIFASTVLNVGFLIAFSAILLLFRAPIMTLFDPSEEGVLTRLWNYIPLLFAASIPRSLSISILQARYSIARVFWIDAIYFLGTPALIAVGHVTGSFSTADDLLGYSVHALAASSAVSIVIVWSHLPSRIQVRTATFGEIWSFGKYVLGGTSIHNVFAQMDVFFISSFAGVTAVAMYSAAKLFTRVFDMLAQVVQMFLVPLSSKHYANNDTEALKVIAEKSISFSTLFILPAILAFVLFPGTILNLFYGGKYDEATTILAVLGILGLIVPLNSVLSSYLIGMGKVKQGFFFGLVLLIFAAASFALLTRVYGPEGTAVGLVLSYGLFGMLLFWYIRRSVPISLSGIVVRSKDAYRFVLRKISDLSS